MFTCSRTSSLGELSSFTNIGTAPWSITTLVFSDVPEAMFVRAQAASNCKKLWAKNVYTGIYKKVSILQGSLRPEVVENPPSLETQQSEERHPIVWLPQLEGYVLAHGKRNE